MIDDEGRSAGEIPLERKRGEYFTALDAGRRRGAAGIATGSMDGCSPTRHRGINLTVPSVPRRLSIRPCTAGAMRAGRASRFAGQVLYELHVGTFTREGTWRAAMERLPLLKESGITTVEVMPVSDFAGRFGWGYDGVFPYAPYTVVWNPGRLPRLRRSRPRTSGSASSSTSSTTISGRPGCVHRRVRGGLLHGAVRKRMGRRAELRRPDAAPVREYFIANAAYWIDEFHLDGLRLDAIQSIYDRSPDHLVVGADPPCA